MKQLPTQQKTKFSHKGLLALTLVSMSWLMTASSDRVQALTPASSESTDFNLPPQAGVPVEIPMKGLQSAELTDLRMIAAFAKYAIEVNPVQAKLIRPEVLLAIQETRAHGSGNSKAKFAMVEIAMRLALDPKASETLDGIRQAVDFLAREVGLIEPCLAPEPPSLSWKQYFDQTLALNTEAPFLSLLQARHFSPVTISWEDIGRTENSVWGDRISDVGIWVREKETDSDSAQLALSVRRDSNFRDKVLIVPSERIKIHQRVGMRTVEKTLPQRLQELGLASAQRDQHVIVSNQFAIVPVPSRGMLGMQRSALKTPPRTAFNFSIYPYGSSNYVITDVIEGSAEAVVGGQKHQFLYANVNGQKAPFTASRASDRPDLLALESQLKQEGLDVDVQRYYLIQIPLKKAVSGIIPANMGSPRSRCGVACDMFSAPSVGSGNVALEAAPLAQKAVSAPAGLTKVAIGHGETEGPYRIGSGFRGQRAEEPIRVTVVYFVTPIGTVREADMITFANTFSKWEQEALWDGSFVLPQ